MSQESQRIIWAEGRMRVEIAKMSGYRASARGFCFPSYIVCSSGSGLIRLLVGKFWSPKGNVWELQKDTNLMFSCICFSWQFASSHCPVVGNCWELWSAGTSLAGYETGFHDAAVVAGLLLPYCPPESFALIPTLAWEQDALGALGSCGPVADVPLPSTTPGLCLRKWAAEGLHKPELLIQHGSSAPRGAWIHSAVKWCRLAPQITSKSSTEEHRASWVYGSRTWWSVLAFSQGGILALFSEELSESCQMAGRGKSRNLLSPSSDTSLLQKCLSAALTQAITVDQSKLQVRPLWNINPRCEWSQGWVLVVFSSSHLVRWILHLERGQSKLHGGSRLSMSAVWSGYSWSELQSIRYIVNCYCDFWHIPVKRIHFQLLLPPPCHTDVIKKSM